MVIVRGLTIFIFQKIPTLNQNMVQSRVMLMLFVACAFSCLTSTVTAASMRSSLRSLQTRNVPVLGLFLSLSRVLSTKEDTNEFLYGVCVCGRCREHAC